MDRLTSYTDNGGGTTSTRTMGYDAYGNMSLVGNSAALPLSPLLPNASQINSSKNQVTMNGTAQTAYDAAGNITTYSNGLTAAYDAEERQTGAGTATYGYDGLGQRVIKASNGVTTYYVYDAVGQLVAEYAAGDASKPPCVTCYLSWDHLGTTRMVTDQNGGVVARHDYMPFGEELLQGNVGRTSLWGSTDFVNQKFTGQERDGETGLDYFHARYFGSGLGRFSSPDPGNAGVDLTDPQTWNGYSYVRNSAMSAVDPSGMTTTCAQSNQYCGYVVFNTPSSLGLNGWATWDPFSSLTLATTPTAEILVVAPFEGGDNPDFGKYFDFLYYGNWGALSLLDLDSDAVLSPSAGTYCQLQRPSGNYTLGKNAVDLFQPQMANALSDAFARLNGQGVVPMITSGFRSASDQLRMQSGASGSNPAAKVSWHQTGFAVDVNHLGSTFNEIKSALTDQGLTWGGTFHVTDPVHFQVPSAGTSPSSALVGSCEAHH